MKVKTEHGEKESTLRTEGHPHTVNVVCCVLHERVHVPVLSKQWTEQEQNTNLWQQQQPTHDQNKKKQTKRLQKLTEYKHVSLVHGFLFCLRRHYPNERVVECIATAAGDQDRDQMQNHARYQHPMLQCQKIVHYLKNHV